MNFSQALKKTATGLSAGTLHRAVRRAHEQVRGSHGGVNLKRLAQEFRFSRALSGKQAKLPEVVKKELKK